MSGKLVDLMASQQLYLKNIQPVPKKGDRSDPANYRPIAVTSVLCKVLEKVLNNHLTRYLEDHSLIKDRQYGFRPKRSTGDLLAYLTHIWGEAVDKRGESLAISLDIAKAFDRVWHKSLLSKLPAYGLPAQFCSWVADFLCERRIRVITDDSSSRFMSVNPGVPQGSVLSPTLFLLHINDLIPLGNIHCSADDSTALHHISEWGTNNLVEFNAKKTQVCAFMAKTSPFLSCPPLQCTTLELESSITMVGMENCCDLNPKNYIESVVKTASRKLGVLNKVRRFFTPEQLCLLYKTQVRSCVEYCSHLWDGSSKYMLDALDRLQQRAIRIIGDEEVTKHVEPLQLRRDVASLSAFYRLYHGECSEELFSLIPPSPFLQRTTSAGFRCHRLTVATIPTRTKKFGDSFLCRTIRKWNALPAHVFPSSYKLGSFKRGVKKQHAGRRVRNAINKIYKTVWSGTLYRVVMSVAARLDGCLQELQRADYSTDEAARRSDAAASRLLALVWEGALKQVTLSSSEQNSLLTALQAVVGPLRARCERLACIFRTQLEDSLLRERSSLQFLLDGYLGAEAASKLREAGLDESVALLDEVIDRFRQDSSDSDDDGGELQAKQPHAGVPSSHTWWTR
ncbi:hypothetical protein evm_000309 [Chilo suppressalis]|nr:hypothetical protein evm_000309 [Chilo suppressalis]